MIRNVKGRTISRGNETNFKATNGIWFGKYLLTHLKAGNIEIYDSECCRYAKWCQSGF